jgi:peptidoglycan/xylan/chitin deacetylase (PgdA/CDA1 family)
MTTLNRATDEKPIVTLSWDDGHPLDMRVAEMMSNYGLSGTFYVPVSIARPQLNTHQLLELSAMGMEIGSHGLTHVPLTLSTAVQSELTDSKDLLEQVLGARVSSFCYPLGKFNRNAASAARAAGYQLARTTLAFCIVRHFDRFRMPVTVQFAPHSCSIHLRHAIKEGNARGLSTWARRWHCETDLRQLSQKAFDDACREQGVFHLWGHSWEIEELGLWDAFREFCEYIGNRDNVNYLTNSGMLSGSGL